jgi:hypothetical protein
MVYISGSGIDRQKFYKYDFFFKKKDLSSIPLKRISLNGAAFSDQTFIYIND